MNFYPFHLGDYKSHTSHLTPMEDLAYRRMIDHYYLAEAPLPCDQNTVARLIGMRDHIDIVNDILCEYFQKTDTGYTHDRCEIEIAKYKQKADRARVLADKRWSGQRRDTISDTTSQTISSATNTITNTITNINKKEDSSDASPAPQAKRPRTNSIPDEEWIESLKATYAWLDIPSEMTKISTWISVNPQRQLTRRFIINWLNRIGKPLTQSTQTTQSKPNKYANAW